MPTPNKCCNPLNKDKHKQVYKNVTKVTENWQSAVFIPFIGNYICSSCRRSMCILNVKLPENFINNTLNNKEEEENLCSSSESDIEIVSILLI